MNVKDFLATVYCCGTCRHRLGFSATCVEGVRGKGEEGACPSKATPCGKWEPVEPGPYADVTPVVCAFARRLVCEAEAFDRERRAEAWLIEKCYTDGRIAQAIDRQNAEGKEGAQ